MKDIRYVPDDKELHEDVFLKMVQQVWPGNYRPDFTKEALDHTINITAWDSDVPCGMRQGIDRRLPF